jgi:putative peptidoglycan lipid II flippase
MVERSVVGRMKVAGLIWACSILLSRVIGLVREAVIGRTLGGGAEADLYWAAFTIPDFFNYLLAGGALGIIFIPIVAGYLERGDEARSWEAVRVVFTALSLLCVALMALLWALTPHLTALVAPGFDEGQREKLTELIRIILPAQYFHVCGSVLSAALQARERHKLPASASLVYALGIVAGGLIGGGEGGAFGFAWGVLAGSFLGPFLLPLIGCLSAGMKWRDLFLPLVEAGGELSFGWRKWLAHKDLVRYLLSSLPIMAAFSIVMFDDWFLRREATLLGEGAVSTLTYSKTLMKVPMGVFGLAAGVGAYPILCKLFASGKTAEMLATLRKAIRGVVVLSLAAQAAFTVAGFEISAVVYGRSRLGTEQLLDMRLALALVSLGLPAWAISNLLSRGFFAMNNTWLSPLLGSAVTLATYPLYYFGGRWFGLVGLAVASSAAIAAYVLVLGWALRRYASKGQTIPRDGLGFWVKTLGALLPAVLAGWLLDQALPAPGPIDSLALLAARGAVTGGTAVVVYGLTTAGLGVEETRALLEAVSLRARRLLRRR